MYNNANVKVYNYTSVHFNCKQCMLLDNTVDPH